MLFLYTYTKFPEKWNKIASFDFEKYKLEYEGSNQERSGNHHFGITDQDVVLPKTGDFGLSSYCSNHGQDENHGEIVEQLNNCLDGVSSNISSDEDKPTVNENSPSPPFPNLSKQQQHRVIKSAKSMAELCEQIQSLGQCEANIKRGG